MDSSDRFSCAHEPLPGRRTAFWGLLGFAVLLVGCFWADEAVFRFVHSNWNYYTRPIPDHLKLATRMMRSMEDWGENIFISCVLFAMWQLDTKRRSRVVLLIAAALLSTIPVEGIKRIVGRERPDLSQGITHFRGPGFGSQGGDFQSFPSGHTAAGASFSGSLSTFYPALKPVAVGLAVGCGASRIWKERHFLSDCFAGGVLGFAFAFYLPRFRVVCSWANRFDAWATPRAKLPDQMRSVSSLEEAEGDPSLHQEGKGRNAA